MLFQKFETHQMLSCSEAFRTQLSIHTSYIKKYSILFNEQETTFLQLANGANLSNNHDVKQDELILPLKYKTEDLPHFQVQELLKRRANEPFK